MNERIIGPVLSVALRTAQRGPMKEVSEATATVDGGLTGDIAVSRDRGITFLSARQWKQVNEELHANLPWHTRRANVLIDAGGLGELIGSTIKVGEVTVKVIAETKPCGLMDTLYSGLRQTLVPDYRGGVYGRVIQGGRICVGDKLAVIPP